MATQARTGRASIRTTPLTQEDISGKELIWMPMIAEQSGIVHDNTVWVNCRSAQDIPEAIASQVSDCLAVMLSKPEVCAGCTHTKIFEEKH